MLDNMSHFPSLSIMQKVVIFGASMVKDGSAEYNEAETLGGFLAENDIGIVNGGYCGTMEAVSKGALAHEGAYVRDFIFPCIPSFVG